ncbi:autophagy 2 [Actinidia rufa]|uniref:Autophagy-related protein 2 n=1 Tax=Actinidia rufa TaxID=165716 RepID=A0A7J0DQ08_9ERIC|nr:autophagy 2 [Actinidia rufa]
MPWKSKGCEIEVEELELVLALCGDIKYQFGSQTFSPSQAGNSFISHGSGRVEHEKAENDMMSASMNVHKGVKTIAKMMKWLLTSFHAKVKKLIVAFDSCLGENEKTIAFCPVGSMGTTIGIKAKFKSPESHRSDFGSDQKPILNSDQIRSAQNWRLSIPPDSSRRYKTPTPNRIKIGPQTSPLALLEVLRIRIMPCGKPRMKDMEEDEPEDDWADQTMHWTQGAPSCSTMRPVLQIRQCIEYRGVPTYSTMRRVLMGTTVAELTSEFQRKGQRRGQRRGLKKEVTEVRKRGREEVKEEISTDDGRGQNPEYVRDLYGWRTTRRRVVGKGIIRFRMADGRSMKVTGVRHVSLRCKIRSDEALKLVEEHSEFLREIGDAAGERRLMAISIGGKMSRQEELLSDMGPVVLARRMDKESNRCTEACKASAGIPEGLQSLQWEVKLPVDEGNVSRMLSCRSYGGAGPEVVGMDNLKTSDYPPMGWRGRLGAESLGLGFAMVFESTESKEGCTVRSERQTVLGHNMPNLGSSNYGGAVLEFIQMDGVVKEILPPCASRTTFGEWFSACCPSNVRTPVVTGKGGGLSGTLKLSILWKNGSLDIWRVDADAFIDPLELRFQPRTIKWFLCLWEVVKDSGKNSKDPEIYRRMESVYFNTTSHGCPSTSYVTSNDMAMFYNENSPSDHCSPMRKETATDNLLRESQVISDWVPFSISKKQIDGTEEEADFGASSSINFQFTLMSVLYGMRNSQSALGNSGMWNWTCSVFSAITAASNLASGSFLIPSEQQHVETNLKATVAGISVLFSLLDHHNSSSHYLGATLQYMFLVLQVCPQEMNFQGTVEYIELNDHFTNVDDALEFGYHACNDTESQMLMIQQMQVAVEMALPPCSSSAKDAGSEKPNGSVSADFPLAMSPMNGCISKTNCKVKLPPFGFWMNFHLINMVLSLLKEVGSSFKMDTTEGDSASKGPNGKYCSSSLGEVKRSSRPYLTTLSPEERLRDNIFLPDARLIFCFPFESDGDFRRCCSRDQFIALDFTSPSTLSEENFQVPTPFPNTSSQRRCSSTTSCSLYLNMGNLDIYLITSTSSSNVESNFDGIQRHKCFAENILCAKNRKGHLYVISILWKEGPVTGPWIAERAKVLATSRDSRGRSSFVGKGYEFASSRGGSIQSELPGSWDHLKLQIKKFQMLLVSNIGGICGANSLWVAHGEGCLRGSITGVPNKKFLLISCSNSTTGRGDGEAGGRLDWLDALSSSFSLPSPESEQASDDSLKKGSSAESVPFESSFVLNLVDVGLSYEPYLKCLMQLSNCKLADCVNGDYHIRVQDIGLLLSVVPGPENVGGTYSAEHLHRVGYVKVAREALVEAYLRINCENDLLWELECSESHIFLDTCHDTTSGLINLIAQLQQLFAPDVEESVVHLQTRWNNVKKAQDSYGTRISSDDSAPSTSQVNTSHLDMKSIPGVINLMDEICEDTFHLDGHWDGLSDSFESQLGTSVHDGLPKETCSLSARNPELIPHNLSPADSMLLNVTESSQPSLLQESFPEFIEGYFLAELLPLSKLSQEKQSPNEIPKYKSRNVAQANVEKVNNGWYEDSSLKFLEDHVSDVSIRTGPQQLVEDEASTSNCKKIDDYGKRSPIIRGRDRTVCLELALSGMDFQYEIYPEGETFVSRISVSVQDFHLNDNSQDAPWKRVLGYDQSKDYPRKSSSKAFRLSLEAVRPDPLTPLEEYRCSLEV